MNDYWQIHVSCCNQEIPIFIRSLKREFLESQIPPFNLYKCFMYSGIVSSSISRNGP